MWRHAGEGLVMTKHPAVSGTAHYYSSFDIAAHYPVVEIAMTVVQISSNSLLIYLLQSFCSLESVRCNYG